MNTLKATVGLQIIITFWTLFSFTITTPCPTSISTFFRLHIIQVSQKQTNRRHRSKCKQCKSTIHYRPHRPESCVPDAFLNPICTKCQIVGNCIGDWSETSRSANRLSFFSFQFIIILFILFILFVCARLHLNHISFTRFSQMFISRHFTFGIAL